MADSAEPASHLASSAHTYRLLVFKDRSASRSPRPFQLPGTASVPRRCISSRETRLWRTVSDPSTPFCEFSCGASVKPPRKMCALYLEGVRENEGTDPAV